METLDTNIMPPKNNPSTFQFALKWALILALVQIVFYLITYLTGLMLNSYISWIMYLIIFAVVFYSTQTFRNKEMGGFISFGKGFSVSFQTIFYAGILTSIYTFIFFKFIDPGMVDKMLQMSQQKLVDKGMPDDQIEMAMKYSRMFMTPAMMFLFTLLGSAFMGAILSLIIAGICRKENNALLPPQ